RWVRCTKPHGPPTPPLRPRGTTRSRRPFTGARGHGRGHDGRTPLQAHGTCPIPPSPGAAMSYVQPADLVDRLTAAGAAKASYSTGTTILRAAMGGAILALAAAFAVTVSTQTGQPLLGAMLFPV